MQDRSHSLLTAGPTTPFSCPLMQLEIDGSVGLQLAISKAETYISVRREGADSGGCGILRLPRSPCACRAHPAPAALTLCHLSHALQDTNVKQLAYHLKELFDRAAAIITA